MAIPYGVQTVAAEGALPLGAEATYVPYVLVGGCLVSCIIWAIGRGAKVKKVKEEVVVEAPVEAPVAPVEEAVVEEVVEEATVVEEAQVEEVEEVVEETVEEVVEE